MKFIWDILFPIQCLGGCGKYDEWICKKCLSEIAEKHEQELNGLIKKIYFCTDYKNELMKKAIHQLKYGYSEEIGKILGKLLVNNIENNFDYIIPVPLAKKRYRERGFNQAELLARQFNIPINLNLIKTKNTKSQMTLSKKHRLINLNNCFKYTNNIDISNKKLLLVDDVYTTGSTMMEMAKTLHKFNPKEICGAVLAKGED